MCVCYVYVVYECVYCTYVYMFVCMYVRLFVFCMYAFMFLHVGFVSPVCTYVMYVCIVCMCDMCAYVCYVCTPLTYAMNVMCVVYVCTLCVHICVVCVSMDVRNVMYDMHSLYMLRILCFIHV